MFSNDQEIGQYWQFDFQDLPGSVKMIFCRPKPVTQQKKATGSDQNCIEQFAKRFDAHCTTSG